MFEEFATDLAEERYDPLTRIFRSAAKRAQHSVELHGGDSESSGRIRWMGLS